MVIENIYHNIYQINLIFNDHNKYNDIIDFYERNIHNFMYINILLGLNTYVKIFFITIFILKLIYTYRNMRSNTIFYIKYSKK